MGDFVSVFDEAGDSAERAQADRAMAVAKQASTGIAGFLLQATGQDDFGHRLALAEDELTAAARTAGISVHALIAEHQTAFDLLMEAKTAGEKNVWGSDKDDVGEGFCKDCEREGGSHYDNCPQHPKNKGKTSARRPVPCPNCNGARAIPAQGHEPYHEVSNGQVRCPECYGHGTVQPDDEPPQMDDRNADERYGETRYDDYYGTGGDAGDQQDRWYHDAAKHLATLKTALEEGQDPLEWLEQEGGGEGQAEKPSEAGIEATHEATKAGVPPFSRDAGYYDRENLSPGEQHQFGPTHISEEGPHPRVHTFGSTGEAYDASQTDDRIKDGDILHVPSEGVTGFLNQAWPVALHHSGQGDKPQGEFHGMLPGVDPHDIFGGGPMGKQYDMPDYSESLAKAKAVHESMGKQAAVVPPF